MTVLVTKHARIELYIFIALICSNRAFEGDVMVRYDGDQIDNSSRDSNKFSTSCSIPSHALDEASLIRTL